MDNLIFLSQARLLDNKVNHLDLLRCYLSLYDRLSIKQKEHLTDAEFRFEQMIRSEIEDKIDFVESVYDESSKFKLDQSENSKGEKVKDNERRQHLLSLEYKGKDVIGVLRDLVQILESIGRSNQILLLELATDLAYHEQDLSSCMLSELLIEEVKRLKECLKFDLKNWEESIMFFEQYLHSTC